VAYEPTSSGRARIFDLTAILEAHVIPKEQLHRFNCGDDEREQSNDLSRCPVEEGGESEESRVAFPFPSNKTRKKEQRPALAHFPRSEQLTPFLPFTAHREFTQRAPSSLLPQAPGSVWLTPTKQQRSDLCRRVHTSLQLYRIPPFLSLVVNIMISPLESAYSPSAELDGGEQAIRFSLAVSVNTSSFTTLQNRRQIFVRRQAWNDSCRILAVVERTISGATGETIRESERFLDLLQDLVLPVYAIPRPVSREEWNIEIAFGQGALRVDYPFGTRDDVLRFQEVLTNYAPVEHFDDITCVVTYKGWRLRQPQYTGFGHIQLWKQPVRVQPCPSRSSHSPISSTGSSNSTFLGRPWASGPPHGIATSPTVRSRPMSIASVQTGYSHAGSTATVQTHAERGTSVLVTQDFRPPVMVAFLKDKGSSEGYSMVKVDSKKPPFF